LLSTNRILQGAIHASDFITTMSSDSEEEIALAASSIIIISKCRKRKRTRKVWTQNWLKQRPKFGVYDTLLREFRLESEADYFNFLRMSPNVFDHLLELVQTDITKQDTVMREAIPPYIKLAATLRYLVTGETFTSLQYLFRIHRTTIGKFIKEVCVALNDKLKDQIKVTFLL